MTNLILCMGLGIFGALCGAYLKRRNQEISLVFSLGVVLVIIFTAMDGLTNLIGAVSEISISENIFLEIPLKILGLTLLGKITMSLCDDAGEKGISSAVSLITKTSSIIIAMPLFKQLLENLRNVIIL